MSVADIFREKRDKVLESWLDLILRGYPHDSFRFFKNRKNSFDNPVGTTLARECPVILDLLIEGGDVERVRDSLDAIVRIRAVQDFSAAQAVGFIYLLKDVIRETLAENVSGETRATELVTIEDRIDQCVLLAFDLYMSCREKLYEIRLDASRRELYLSDRMRSREQPSGTVESGEQA